MVCTSAHLKSDVYASLLVEYQPKCIADEDEYNRVTGIIETLLDREDLEPEELAILDLLAQLADSYENNHHPIPKSKPEDILVYLMDARGLKQSDLVGLIGSRGVVSDVVNGKRSISKKQAKILGEKFGVSPGLFI